MKEKSLGKIVKFEPGSYGYRLQISLTGSAKDMTWIGKQISELLERSHKRGMTHNIESHIGRPSTKELIEEIVENLTEDEVTSSSEKQKNLVTRKTTSSKPKGKRGRKPKKYAIEN